MSYKEAIELISNCILNFDQEINEDLLNLLEQSSHERFRIYRKNYFFGALESLSADLVGLQVHVESGNFRYLVKDFLIKNHIRSININDLSESFAEYLEKSYDFHQDPIIAPLGKIDLLYVNGEFRSKDHINVPEGLFTYWCYLNDQVDSYQDIDFSKYETLQVIEENGERYVGKIRTQ